MMFSRPTFSLFPFLSILLGTLGVVAFIAMALTLVGGASGERQVIAAYVRVGWGNAPSYVRAVPAECRPDGALLQESDEFPPRFFSLERLKREAAIVRDLHERAAAQSGGILTRDQEWLFFKAVIERDPRLKDSLTQALHQIEMANLKGQSRTRREERYPILLVAADAMDCYDLTTLLLESTSRLQFGLEPVPPGWHLRSTPARRQSPSTRAEPAQPGGAQP